MCLSVTCGAMNVVQLIFKYTINRHTEVIWVNLVIYSIVSQNLTSFFKVNFQKRCKILGNFFMYVYFDQFETLQ